MYFNSVQRLAIGLTGLTAFVSLLLLSLKISSPVSYADFIAGHITWTGATKLQDLLVMPLAVIGTFLSVSCFIALFERVTKNANAETSSNLALHLVYWSLPALAIIAVALTYKNFDRVFFALSVIGIIFLSLSYFIANKNTNTIRPETLSMGLLSVIFVALLPLNFFILLKFLPSFAHMVGGFNVPLIARSSLGLCLLLLVAYVIFWRVKSASPYKALALLVLFGQLSLPLFYLSLYPARLQDPTGLLLSYNTGFGLKAIIVGLILVAVVDCVYRYLKYRSPQTLSAQLFSPWAIFALLFALKAGITNTPTIPIDDYHFGEHLVGWWVYLQGYIPYLDYTPAHGIINNDLSGLINVAFYDGTAASLGEAQRLTLLLLSLAAFFAIYYFTGSLLWAFLSVYLLGARITWLFFMPFLTLWFNRSLLENKLKWSALWFATAPIAILGVPPQGLLLVVASGVIPLYFLWHTITTRDWQVIKPVALAAAAIALLYTLTPLGTMLINAINYVVVNGSINQAAYGVPWEISFANSSPLTEAIRMSWIVAPLASLFALYAIYRQKRFVPFLTLPLCVTFIFSFLLIPYSMGRIDPGGVSRPGMVAILLIAGVMALSFWPLLNRHGRAWLLLGSVFFSALLNFASFAHQPLLSAAAPILNVGHLINPTQPELANMGRATMDGAHWDRINRLNNLLNSKLKPQESYLDLTSRNAQYFYLNRKPVIPVTAPYNMISHTQQLDAIAVLNKALPRLALLEGENIVHDGGGVSLRNHYLFRFLVEHYEPFEENGFIIGLSTESIARGDWGARQLPTQMEKMALFERAFSRPRMHLEKLPSAWGKSISSLDKTMQAVTTLDALTAQLNHLTLNGDGSFTVTGSDPFGIYDLTSLSIAGKNAGLLRFDFTCINKQATPVLQLFFWGDERSGPYEESSIFLSADNGSLVIPLDAAPRWLLLNHVRGIRIDLSNSGACASYKIDNLSLYQRNRVNL